MTIGSHSIVPVHLRLLGDLIEFAIERGWTFQQFKAVVETLALPMDDHARDVVANTGLREGTVPAPDPFAPEERLAVAGELLAVLRRRYGATPEAGADAVAMLLVSLLGPIQARALIGVN